MGKRELLLILAFAVAGVLAYQFAAPSRPAGTRQVGVGTVIEHMRRAVRGNRASAELTTTQSQAIDATITELRLRLASADVKLQGEERDDVAVDLHVWSNGYDEAEAQRLAKQTVLTLDPAGSTLNASIKYPEPGSQRATVTLKVPSRLRVRLESSGPATLENVSAVELNAVRGRTSISRISGAVSGSFRGSELTLTEIGIAKLTTQSSDVKISGVKDLTMTVRGGELRAEKINGTVELECSQSDVTLDQLGDLSVPLRVNASGGTVTVKGLRTEARIDGRNTGLDVTMERAAPVAIYSEGDDGVALMPPPGGYQLDALAREGRIEPLDLLTELGLTITKVEGAEETRVTGAVAGGGPTITVRATRGDIVVRPRSSVDKPK
jgi:Putative adhesin